MRLKDRGDAYAAKVMNICCDQDEEDSYESSRVLFNEAIAEGRRNALGEAIKMFEGNPNGMYTASLAVAMLKRAAERTA